MFYLSLTATLVIALAIGAAAHRLRRAGGVRWWAGTALAIMASGYFWVATIAMILDKSGVATRARGWAAVAAFAVAGVFSAAGLRSGKLH